VFCKIIVLTALLLADMPNPQLFQKENLHRRQIIPYQDKCRPATIDLQPNHRSPYLDLQHS